jgi:hypothetical protein
LPIGNFKRRTPRFQRLDVRRVGDAPVGSGRVAGPDRAGLTGGAGADGKDEIDLRRARGGKFIPRFAARFG